MDKVDWSKAPEGAKFAAWRKGTVKPMVCWYRIVDGGWHYWYEEDSGPWSPCADGSPAHHPLEPRPQPDNKEGEGVEWYEDASFPPGGAICEAYVKADARTQHGPAGKWVVGISRGKAVASNAGWGGIFEDEHGVMHFVGSQSYFRPIQSHRDKAIEAAHGVLYQNEDGICCRISLNGLERLYEEGMLKLPGEEAFSGADKYRQKLVDALNKAVSVNAEYDSDTGEMKSGQEDWIKEAEALIIEIEEASDDQ